LAHPNDIGPVWLNYRSDRFLGVSHTGISDSIYRWFGHRTSLGNFWSGAFIFEEIELMNLQDETPSFEDVVHDLGEDKMAFLFWKQGNWLGTALALPWPLVVLVIQYFLALVQAVLAALFRLSSFEQNSTL
jgi:hypothetical protein